MQTQSMIRQYPLGAVASIAPWNYPLLMGTSNNPSTIYEAHKTAPFASKISLNRVTIRLFFA